LRESKGKQVIKTAALYARYSSDLQKDKSIADQQADCENYAEKEKIKIIATFSDRAKSAATMFDRDGLIELMRAAKEKKFSAVIVESLDRLSRDTEDLAGIFKRLTFNGVAIHTLNEGVATSLNVGIRAIVGPMQLTDMAAKVRRGQRGMVRAGLAPGSIVYGYRSIPGGKAGERERDDATAKIVTRIFTEYSNQRSPVEICGDLTKDGIPTPRGGASWNRQSLYAILENRMYIGEIIWGRCHTVRNPDGGKHIKRKNAPGDQASVSAPQLRIIPQELWNAVEAVRRARATVKFGPTGKIGRRPSVARTDHLLAGMLQCGVCNGHMVISSTDKNGKPRIACAAAIHHATCDHKRSYDLDRLQKAVIDTMRPELMTREALAELVRSFRARSDENKARNRKNLGDKAAVHKRLNGIEVRLHRLADAIENGGDTVKSLLDRIAPLEIERAGLQERLRLLDAENKVQLHPNAADNWRDSFARLHHAMTTEPNIGPQTLAAFRNIYDTVVVKPVLRNEAYKFATYLRAESAMGVNHSPPTRTAKQVLEEQGVFNSAIDKHGCAFLSAKQKKIVVCFGHFIERLAA
jgi:site-specific DNA recombinase